MKMKDFKRGMLGMVNDPENHHHKIVFLMGDDDKCHMVGHEDKWSKASQCNLEVIDITDSVLKGVLNATK